jgi:hypothetical protein
MGKHGCPIPDWAARHPHATAHYGGTDTIYVAAVTGTTYNAGVFRSVNDQLILTAPGRNRSVWRLPKWFHYPERRSALSYHGNPDRWWIDDHYAYVQSVGRGQEFVLNADHYPEAIDWAKQLVAENAEYPTDAVERLDVNNNELDRH